MIPEQLDSFGNWRLSSVTKPLRTISKKAINLVITKNKLKIEDEDIVLIVGLIAILIDASTVKALSQSAGTRMHMGSRSITRHHYSSSQSQTEGF